MRCSASILGLFSSALIAVGAVGADVPPLPVKPVVRMVSPGMYEVGKVRLDQKTMSISFAGTLNMKRGLLEYLLVNSKGSAHESLLVTEVEATDIHVAMLLLGAKGGAVVTEAPPAQLDARYFRTAPKLTGDAVLIRVKWKEKEVEKTASIEDWIFNDASKKPVEPGAWTYNGSMVHEGRFLAQADGNLVALVTSPSALINNPRKGNDDDHQWTANGDTTPGIGTLVEVIIQLVPPTTHNSIRKP